MTKPGYGEASKWVGEPDQPLPPGERGQAMAIAAFALEALTGSPIRLHWCVDIDRDVGRNAYDPFNPSRPYPGPTMEPVNTWGAYLNRLRNALDAQPWHQHYKAQIALVCRHTTGSTGRQILTTWDLPWCVNFARLAKASPPVGVWRLAALPPPAHPPESHRRQGDQLPDMFWFDGIPFAVMFSSITGGVLGTLALSCASAIL